MKKRIVSVILILALLCGICVYAVPVDLWNGDERVYGVFAQDSVEVKSFDFIQELLEYIGVADKESISGDKDVKAGVVLGALCEIVGIEYADDADNKAMLDALKAAKFLKEDAKASNLTLQELLYAATRITGWSEAGDSDFTVYPLAKKAGLMTNVSFSTGRNLTCSEAAQLIYNILAVNRKVAPQYNPGHVYLDKEIKDPILKSKYGIVLKTGIVASLFGESIYSTSKIKENEIEIDSKVYKLNPAASTEGLFARSVAFFLEEETNMVLFAEPASDNIVHFINYGENPQFKADRIEYETDDGEEYVLDITGSTKVIYNGLLTGSYTPELMNRYFDESVCITAVDNNDDGIYDYLIIRKWETFVVDTGAGPGGVFGFALGRTFNGSSTFDVTPDDKKIHITVLKNGEPFDYTGITDGSVVSISSTLNETGHKYITIEAGYQTVTGTFNSMYGDVYIVEGVAYPVAKEYREAQQNLFDVNTPVLGEVYKFYIDITGRIVYADVANEYTYGYLVKMERERGLDKPYNFKIFSQDGEMLMLPVAEKVMLYTPENPSGTQMEAEDIAKRILDSANEFGDYRRFIQYKTKKGELSDIWFAMDNTDALKYGESGYQFTLDKSTPDYVFYDDGLITFQKSDEKYGQAFWGKNTILFAIPEDKDAVDGKYSIKSVAYNGSRWTEPTDFYSVDDWNMIEAAVMHMSAEAAIDNYSPVYVVDRVVSAINTKGDPCYKIYGYDNAVEKEVLIGENVVSEAGKGGWLEDIKPTDLKFGDLIQVSQVDGMADSLRVIYRHGGYVEDFDKNSNGDLDGGGQLEIETGTYAGRRNSIFRFDRKIGGNTMAYMKPYSAGTPANVVDLTSGKVAKTSVADLEIGDKMVIHNKWSSHVRTYVFRD